MIMTLLYVHAFNDKFICHFGAKMHSSFHTRKVSNLADACLDGRGCSREPLNLAPSLPHIMHWIELRSTNFEKYPFFRLTLKRVGRGGGHPHLQCRLRHFYLDRDNELSFGEFYFQNLSKAQLNLVLKFFGTNLRNKWLKTIGQLRFDIKINLL